MHKLSQMKAGVALAVLSMLVMATPVLAVGFDTTDIDAAVLDATTKTAAIAGSIVLIFLGIKVAHWIKRAFSG
jgi:hypothetical protein